MYSGILQCNIDDIIIDILTASLFTTGRIPGNPISIATTFSFGIALYSFFAGENTFDFVSDPSQCISRPIVG